MNTLHYEHVDPINYRNDVLVRANTFHELPAARQSRYKQNRNSAVRIWTRQIQRQTEISEIQSTHHFPLMKHFIVTFIWNFS